LQGAKRRRGSPGEEAEQVGTRQARRAAGADGAGSLVRGFSAEESEAVYALQALQQ